MPPRSRSQSPVLQRARRESGSGMPASRPIRRLSSGHAYSDALDPSPVLGTKELQRSATTSQLPPRPPSGSRRSSAESSLLMLGTPTVSTPLLRRESVPEPSIRPNSRALESFVGIDWTYERRKDKKHSSSLPWIILTLTGIMTAILAAISVTATDVLTDWRLGYCKTNIFLPHSLCCYESFSCESWVSWSSFFESDIRRSRHLAFLVYVVSAVVMSSFAASFVKDFSPYAAGSGLPETKTLLSGFAIRGFLGWMALVVKFFGLILSVSAGLMLGKEGPFVQISACIANLLCRLFHVKSEATKRDIISAGTASGVSVAFGGATIGGTLFVQEEASFYFSHWTLWRSFFAALVGMTTLRLLNPGHSPKGVLDLSFIHEFSYRETPFFIILAISIGLLGVLFNRINVKLSELRKTYWADYPILEVAVIAALTASLSYPFLYMKGSLYELLNTLLGECSIYQSTPLMDQLCDMKDFSVNVQILFIVLVLVFFLTALTFGSRIPSGLFVSSMSIGAILGRITGMVVQYLVDNYDYFYDYFNCSDQTICVSPGLYGVVGAIAMLASVTRMSVSIILIFLELTGTIEFLVPIFVGCFFSRFTADLFGKESLYEDHIKLNGYPHMDVDFAIKSSVSCHKAIADLKQQLVYLLAYGETLSTVQNVLNGSNFKGLPIVSDPKSRRILGYVRSEDIQSELAKRFANPSTNPNHKIAFSSAPPPKPFRSCDSFLNFSHLIDDAPTVVVCRTPLARVGETFRQLGIDTILVSDNSYRLHGILTRKDVFVRLPTFPGYVVHSEAASEADSDSESVITEEEVELPYDSINV